MAWPWLGIGCALRDTGYGLRVSCCELRGFGVRGAGCAVRDSVRELRVSGHPPSPLRASGGQAGYLSLETNINDIDIVD